MYFVAFKRDTNIRLKTLNSCVRENFEDIKGRGKGLICD